MKFPPRGLAELSIDRLRRVRGVFTDIDDTLTTRGDLTAEAYAAMQRLFQAGLRVVPITGRPAGWCDHIARMWPVTAVVGENGADQLRIINLTEVDENDKAKEIFKRV